MAMSAKWWAGHSVPGGFENPEKIIWGCINRHFGWADTDLQEDLAQVARLAYVNACTRSENKEFESPAKLRSYLSTSIMHAITEYLRDRSQMIRIPAKRYRDGMRLDMVSLDALNAGEADFDIEGPMIDPADVYQKLRAIVSGVIQALPNERERMALRAVLLGEAEGVSVSRKLGKSRQWASERLARYRPCFQEAIIGQFAFPELVPATDKQAA